MSDENEIPDAQLTFHWNARAAVEVVDLIVYLPRRFTLIERLALKVLGWSYMNYNDPTHTNKD